VRQRHLVIFLMFVVLLASPLSTIASAQQDIAQDQREATFAAQEILRLAAERKFNAMYDRIHPDAHAIIPRAVAVGTFEEVYSLVQAGQAKITDVQFGKWTWGVTGKTYDNAAQVTYQMPYVDENGKQQTLTDDMYLVKDGAEWRWFFGATKEFVDAQIARFGERGTPLTQGDLLKNVTNDLDSFYRDVLSYTKYTYYSPKVVVVEQGESVQTGCGPAQSGFWAFYCPPDQTVYLDDPLLTQLQQQHADFAAAFVIAHEWAHHVQTGVGIERSQYPTKWNQVYSIELELMADCMAGAWALDVDTRGLLNPGDIDTVVQFTIKYLGDPAYVSEYDPQAHGTADQRVQSILNGYENGFLGCNISI
jgi:predicted metalloprotease